MLNYNAGGPFFTDAKSVHINAEHDVDDFFITTSTGLYEKLKARDYNVVLQDNENDMDDGSLSIFYGRKNLGYINIEAEHGHLKQQTQMLLVLIDILN